MATVAAILGDLLLMRLSRSEELQVISRLSSDQFKARNLTLREIEEVCKADVVITGRLHEMGPRCHVVLELIRPSDGQVLWSDGFVFEPGALTQSPEGVTPSMAQAVVGALDEVRLHELQISPLPNLDGQALRFAAIRLMHRQSQGEFDRAFDILHHLADLHPRAPEPHAWLAKWHVLRLTKGWTSHDEASDARPMFHVRRALEFDPQSALAMAMEAFVHCHLSRDLDTAQESLTRALEVGTNEPWVWLVKSTIDSLLGQGASSWDSAMQARHLSPLDPLRHYFDSLAASAAVAAGRWEHALELAGLSLSKDSRHLPTLRAQAIALVQLGRVEEARQVMERVLALAPGFTLAAYVRDAPKGSGRQRAIWADSLRCAGAP